MSSCVEGTDWLIWIDWFDSFIHSFIHFIHSVQFWCFHWWFVFAFCLAYVFSFVYLWRIKNSYILQKLCLWKYLYTILILFFLYLGLGYASPYFLNVFLYPNWFSLRSLEFRGISRNCDVLTFWREFPGISEILKEVMGNL